MTKILIIIVVIILVAAAGYFFLSDKPLIQINLFPSAPIVSPTLVLPVSETMVTIKDCKADPYILQISEGTEIIITNADNQPHTLFIAGPNKEVKLPANGSVKVVAKFPQGSNFTYNYLCDQQGYSSSGGAIFITP